MLLNPKHLLCVWLLCCSSVLCAQHGKPVPLHTVELAKDDTLSRFEKSFVGRWLRAGEKGILIAPTIGFAPETKWSLGLWALKSFRMGTPSDTRASNASASFNYTQQHQILFLSRYAIFTKKDGFFMRGTVSFVRFPELYFGIGNYTPARDREQVNYSMWRFEHRLIRKLRPGLYAGVQYRYITMYDLKIKPNGLLDQSQTPGHDGAVLSGPGLSLVWDNRDNVVTPQNGFYAEWSSSHFTGWLGSSHPFSQYILDIRQYWLLAQQRSGAHIFAMQFYGSFNDGVAPFKMMSEMGGDMIMRGYYRGRYRDDHLMAIQAEWRFPVTGRFGGTLFGGTGHVFSQVPDLQYSSMRFAFGTGIRFQINQKDRMNLRLDFGITPYGAKGLYLEMGEAF